MSRREFDAFEEVFGKRLSIHRALSSAPLFASLKERFIHFPGAPENWSKIQWEPTKVSIWSSPSGAHHQEIIFDAAHRVRWSFGSEFGGPLVTNLSLSHQGNKIAEFSLRIKHLTSREQAKDLAFRCSHLSGLSSYRLLQEDEGLLLLEFSIGENVALQSAYRESTASPLAVPAPSSPANFTKQRAQPPRSSPPQQSPR